MQLGSEDEHRLNFSLRVVSTNLLQMLLHPITQCFQFQNKQNKSQCQASTVGDGGN